MDAITFILMLLLAVVLYIVVTKIGMVAANYVGEKLGLAKLINLLLQKRKK
ncbi:hypothetical protein [Cellulosilyticum sp. I15G10I2]|uniref:hypothetical protein n=1 Tax=Cellulosilyticum sp. I15G10I2 TaxID=1892843 RepID=UPI0014960BE2|nr:hypothetical protein [Cellulosilyticum sp. I15G10I2]